ADADVHDITDTLTRKSFPGARVDTFTAIFHLLQHGIDFRHHILSVQQHRLIGAVAERGVEHGALFGGVDLFCAEHGFHGFVQFTLTRQLLQELQGAGSEDVLGIVEQYVFELQRESRKALRVFSEQLAHMRLLHVSGMRLQLLPGFCSSRLYGWEHYWSD